MMKHCNYVKHCACNCRAACASSKPWLILTQSVSHSFAESKESNSDEESNTSFFHLLISCTSQKRQCQSWSVMSKISSNKFEYFLHLIVLVILTQKVLTVVVGNLPEQLDKKLAPSCTRFNAWRAQCICVTSKLLLGFCKHLQVP